MNVAIAKLLPIEHLLESKMEYDNCKQGERVILIWLDRYYYLVSIEECSDNGRLWYFLKLWYRNYSLTYQAIPYIADFRKVP